MEGFLQFPCLQGLDRPTRMDMANNTRKTFALAKEDSLHHYVFIALKLVQLSRHLQNEVIDTLCGSLLPSLIDDDLTIEELQYAREKSLALIIGIGSMCDIIRNVGGSDPLVHTLARNMPKLLPWVQALYENYLRPGQPDYNNHPDQSIRVTSKNSMRHICLFLWTTIGHSPLFAKMPKMCAPAVCGLVARLWIRDGWEHLPGLNYVLARVMHSCTEVIDPYARITGDCLVLAAADPGVGGMQAVLAKGFKLLGAPPPVGVPTFNTLVNIATGGKHQVAQALKAHPRWVRRMSKAAMNLIKNGKEYADVRVVTVYYLGNFVMQHLSAWQLKEAVRNGLIEAFVHGSRIIPQLSKSLHKDIIDVMEYNVSLGLVSYSLLSATLHATDQIDPDVARNAVPRGRLWNVWDTFCDILLERIALRVLYTLGMITGSRWQCDECTRQFMKKKLKRCGSCRFSLYCSKECQAMSWKNGHKNQCKKRQRDPRKLEDGDDVMLNSDEHAFLFCLACTDVRRHLLYLQNLAKTDFDDTPLCQLGVSLDYTRHPPALRLFRVKEVLSSVSFSSASEPEGWLGPDRSVPSVFDPENGCDPFVAQRALSASEALPPGSDPTRSPALFCVDALRGRTHVRITLSPLLSGVCLRPPRRRPDHAPAPFEVVRRAAVDGDGRPLVANYDEVDELLFRLRREEAASGRKRGDKAMWLWDHLEPAVLDLADKLDWPFVSAYPMPPEEVGEAG